MTFDKWFNKQSRLLKILLLILPVVGWIVECLIRLSVMLRTKRKDVTERIVRKVLDFPVRYSFPTL